METNRLWRPALVLLIAFTVLTGLAYPGLITAIGSTIFADQARGTLVMRDDRVVGSRLIGQPFSDPAHFWSRPSATSPQPNNASASSGSNLGPLNPALVDAVKGRIDALKAADKDAGVVQDGPVPLDLVTASASGLDPEIGVAAAVYQSARVAHASGLPKARVDALIASHTEGPQWGFLGDPRINVLALNLAIDAERNASRTPTTNQSPRTSE